MNAFTCDPAEEQAMNNLAHILMAEARHHSEKQHLDPITAAGALGLAMTRVLAMYVGNTPEDKMKAARIMADSGMKAMADIVSTPTPGRAN